MKKPTLVILAAGMGGRYGGLKQMDTFTIEGDTIIDFSIYDALRAGFGKLVFIIRKSFGEIFKKTFDEKLKGRVEVIYVYQELDSIAPKYINSERVKPWGTGHALLMARDVVEENFAVINADDFYGRRAFEGMAKSLTAQNKTSCDFSMVAYLLKNTLSDYGAVSRGECEVNEQGYLTNVTERTHIEKIADKLMYKNSDGQLIPIDENAIVSMNFWGFTPKCFEFFSNLFQEFLEVNKDNFKAEFYIPSVVNAILKSGAGKVEVLKSDALWFGVTYKEDKAIVQQIIQQLKADNIYPKNLW